MSRRGLFMSRYNSPFGEMIILSTEKGLCYLALPGMGGMVRPWARKAFGNGVSIVHETRKGRAIEEIEAYFRGKIRDFSLPLEIKGTPFQKKVWEALMSIPYGETRSYGDIAKAIGNPKAFRAVGWANAQNPIPIVIPCHRVIQSDGSLGGYGGGLELKRKLLDLEASFR